MGTRPRGAQGPVGRAQGYSVGQFGAALSVRGSGVHGKGQERAFREGLGGPRGGSWVRGPRGAPGSMGRVRGARSERVLQSTGRVRGASSARGSGGSTGRVREASSLLFPGNPDR